MFKKILSFFSQTKKPDPAQQAKIEQSYTSAKSNLKSLTKDLTTLAAEPDYISGPAKAKAAQLLSQARERLLLIETKLEHAHLHGQLTEDEARAWYWETVEVKNSLSLLRQRKIYRNNLQVLQAQIAAQQLAVLTGEMKDQLQMNMAEQEKQIAAASSLAVQSIYQRNLELYREMLEGKRPYVPLKLLNEVSQVEQELNKLDTDLAR